MCESLEQLVTLMTAALAAAYAGVRFIDYDEWRADTDEFVTPCRLLDEVQANDGERMLLEQARTDAEATFEAVGARRGDGGRIDAEPAGEFSHPLVHEMRRADDREPRDLAAIEHLACDQPGFDRLADADIVGNEQTDRIELQRHEQGRELIGARIEGQATEA